MSAELLRRAAALMRERAEANYVTPSPWGFAGVDGHGFAVHHGEHDTVALYANLPDAKHIASWHPAVALAVANLLDSLAEHVESHDCEAHCEPFGCQPVLEATELARAYLGEDA